MDYTSIQEDAKGGTLIMHIVPKVLDQGFSVLGYAYLVRGHMWNILAKYAYFLQKEWAVFDGQKPINRWQVFISLLDDALCPVCITMKYNSKILSWLSIDNIV